MFGSRCGFETPQSIYWIGTGRVKQTQARSLVDSKAQPTSAGSLSTLSAVWGVWFGTTLNGKFGLGSWQEEHN